MSNNWNISDPLFESDILNPQLKFAYWEGHRNFVYDFLNFVKPERILELGSQYGCSLFAMAQAVKDYDLKSDIHAVDFWKGDIGAPDSGEKIFSMVKETAQKYYKDVNITLHQMSFDDARIKFKEESIDIIHIDGGHRYEDVDHDFNKWFATLRKNGIILFHDVYSNIDQGSCDHWKYIKQCFDVYFDFTHSCGLGVLFPKGDYWYQKLKEADFFPYVHDIYLYKAQYIYTKARFDELAGLYEERYREIEKQSKMISDRDQAITSQAKMIDDRDKEIEVQTKMIEDRDEEVALQAKMIDDRDVAIESQARMIDDRDQTILSQTKMIEDRDAIIEVQTKMIEDRDAAIEEQTKMIKDRDAAIEAQTKMIKDRDEAIEAQTKMIEDRDAAIEAQTRMIEDRDAAIAAQTKMIEDRDAVIASQTKVIAERD